MKEHSSAQEKISDLETAEEKLQASQRYAEELEQKLAKVEAERDDYQRKSSDANEWIMQNLNTQVRVTPCNASYTFALKLLYIPIDMLGATIVCMCNVLACPFRNNSNG